MTNTDTTKFDEIIIQLFQTAGEDGIVSSDEGAIIMKVKTDLKKYVEGVKEARQSDALLAEAMQLEELKNSIIANAGIIAAEDYKITDDEKALIRKLLLMLSEEN